MAWRGLTLSAKINSAVVLPILLAFIASGAAYIAIGQVSDEAQQVVGSGAALQSAGDLLVTTEQVGRLIGESGTQQEVAARLTPEVERMRAIGAAVAEAVQGVDAAVAEKLAADMKTLDEVVRDSVIARSNITDVVSLFPSAFAAFAEATTRLSLAVRATGAQDAERQADEFSGAAGDLMQAIAAFAGSADNSGFETARSALSAFSDKIEAASAIVKAAGQSVRALERAAEKERSKLYGLVGQQGASLDRLESVRKRMHDILERARSAARILKSDSEARAAAGLAGISWWANALALGAMFSIALGIALAALLHRFTKRVITVPLGRLEAIMTRLARGDTQVQPQGMQRSDAIGAMARAVVVFRDAAVEKLRLETETAEQRRAAELVNRAGASLNEIVHSIKRVAEIVSEIASATSEQSIGIDQVNIALTQMDGVTQQNSALVEENAATTRALQQHSQAMDERVSFFRVADAPPAAAAVVALERPVGGRADTRSGQLGRHSDRRPSTSSIGVAVS